MSRRTFVGVVGGTALATTVATAPVAAVDQETLTDWMADVPNYDGSITDMTGEDTVTVTVGADDGYTYDPPAVRISPETTIVWEWTGEGGSHDVADEGDAFQSDLYDGAGETFEHTFTEDGRFMYGCTPHIPMGMKGAVIVSNADDGESTAEGSLQDEAGGTESTASTTGVIGMATMGLLILLSPFGLWFGRAYLADGSSSDTTDSQ